MNEKKAAWKAGVIDALKRFGFSSLWLAAAQTLSCAVCFGSLYLFSRDHRWEWLIYALGFLLPLLWGLGGYCLLVQYRPRDRWQIPAFLALWTALPAVLGVWAGLDGPDILLIVLYPQLMSRLAWFHPLFDGPQSAHVLNTLRPLAAAGTHILMMAGFAAGLYLRHQKGKKQQQAPSD